MVVPDHRAGRAVGCPRCRQEVAVPELGEASESKPPPLPSRKESASSPPPLKLPPEVEGRKEKKKRWTDPPSKPASSGLVAAADAAAAEAADAWAAELVEAESGAAVPPALPQQRKQPDSEPEASKPSGSESADDGRHDREDAAKPSQPPIEKAEQSQAERPPPAAEAAPAEASSAAAPAVAGVDFVDDEVAAPPRPGAPAADIEPPPLPKPLPGLEPSVEGRRSAMYLALAVAFVGLFSGIPAIVYMAQHVPLGSLAMPRWVACLLMLSGLQLAYAFYVAQLPDWSTVWVVAITMVGVATLNSLLLATTLLSSGTGGMIGLLELHDQVRGGRAAGWCFIMLCLSITVAYCAGRMASRWHTAETARLQALHVID